MKYGAVTFDTQFVFQNSFHFESGALSGINAVNRLGVNLILSEVVQAEIEKHLAERIKNVRDTLKKTMFLQLRLDCTKILAIYLWSKQSLPNSQEFI